jgi:hypothetical protein
MKNIYVFLLSLVTAGLLVTSCIKDEDIQTQPECVITDFSINDIETEVTIQLADGCDSIITRVIGGESIRFNINQIENKIYSVDSLPKWADITGIVPKVSTTGYVYVKEASDSTFRYFASGNDSIDFTKPVKFLVMASDGVSSKEYTAQIFKRESETDSLVWRPVEGVDLQLEGKHHSLVFADRIYVFSENDGTPTVTSSSFLSEGASWRKPEPITCKQGIINWESVVSYGEKLYSINSDGKICHSTNEERGVTWTVASERTFTKLLSAVKNYIYACDYNAIWASTDLENWKESGNYDLDMLLHGGYTPELKLRIAKGNGHLSNEQCASVIRRVYHPKIEAIFLCHLSENNNTPELAHNEISKALKAMRANTQLECLPRRMSSPMYCFGE